MSAMNGLIYRYVSLSLLAALTGACVEKEGESSTDTSGTTADPTGNSSGDSTGDSTGTTDETTTGETTTGEPTTGEPGGLCEAWAKWIVMCGNAEPGSEAQVVSECEDQRALTEAVYGPECLVKSDAYIECESLSMCSDDAACEAEYTAVEICQPEAGASCKAFAAAVVACEPGEDEAAIASNCQFELNAGGYMNPACGAALDSLYGCLGGQDCMALEDGTGCDAEAAMVEASCAGENGAPARPGALEFETHRR
jgi:hypothetical protein